MQRFKNILFVLGNNMDAASPSLMRAITLAKANQANLTLLYILPKLSLTSFSKKVGVSSQQLKEKILAHEKDKLNQLLSSLEREPGLDIRAKLKVGKKYIESIREVLSEGFDLVVKEAETLDWFSRLLGSDDMHLLRKCPCPVWLIKKDEKPGYQNIMAAVDFATDKDQLSNDDLNQTILELACSLSLSELGTVHAVNVYDVPESGFISLWVEKPDEVEKEMAASEHLERQYSMNALLNKLKKTVGEDTYHYLSLRFHIIPGTPEYELPKMANKIKADLVVMGTVSRTGIAGVIIGNTAETVLSQLDCSVLAIKPKGFKSPIE